MAKPLDQNESLTLKSTIEGAHHNISNGLSALRELERIISRGDGEYSDLLRLATIEWFNRAITEIKQLSRYDRHRKG